MLGGMSGGCVVGFVCSGVLGSEVVLVCEIIVVFSMVVFVLLRN